MSVLWKQFRLNRKNTFSVYRSCRCLYLSKIHQNDSLPVSKDIKIPDEFFLLPEEEKILCTKQKVSVLEEPSELVDVSHIGPPVDYRSFNFAAYADQSVVLQKLIDLGIDFYKIELKKKLPTYLLQLDLERDVNPYIKFLHDNGVPLDHMGVLLTANPFIFQNSMNDLQIRLNYLESKQFNPDMISKILMKESKWLNFSTVYIDNRLGFFQRDFKLKGFEVRQLTVDAPKIMLTHPKKIDAITWELRDVTGFSPEECKQILLKQPYVWYSIDPENLKKTIDVMTVEMELPLNMIAADPSGLVNRFFRIRERHLFLKSLGKAQYDPKKPNFVSIRMITHGNDATFCERVAKTSVETYNLFLKSM